MSSADSQTLPPPPSVLAEHFPSEAVATLTRYAAWLADAGIVRGLVGPREVPRLWERHLMNSVALSELLPAGTRLVDIGTGAGLPGLAIACVRPDLRVDLVESLQRRRDFLTEVVSDLELDDRVRVVRGRAEDAAVVSTVGAAPFVTARAVAPLGRLVTWALPLLAPDGVLLALKGSAAEDELSAAADVIRAKTSRQPRVLECGVGWVEPPTRVVEVVRTR